MLGWNLWRTHVCLDLHRDVQKQEENHFHNSFHAFSVSVNILMFRNRRRITFIIPSMLLLYVICFCFYEICFCEHSNVQEQVQVQKTLLSLIRDGKLVQKTTLMLSWGVFKSLVKSSLPLNVFFSRPCYAWLVITSRLVVCLLRNCP